MRRIFEVLNQFFPSLGFWLMFVYRNKYLPNFRKPKTFNEKINFRKRHWTDKSMVSLSDKLEMKNYLRALSQPYPTPETYFEGLSINEDVVRSVIRAKGSCMAKANHNSGPVFFLDAKSTESDLSAACCNLNQQLLTDYGRVSGESWYSEIKPRVFLEEVLSTPSGGSLDDFKFHVFRRPDGAQHVVIQVDFDRNTLHTRSLFSEDLRWLPVGIKYPVVNTVFPCVDHVPQMIDAAKDLGSPFSYVRIDMYSTMRGFFIGEFTFAHGSGGEEFTNYGHDLWMGELWSEFDELNP